MIRLNLESINKLLFKVIYCFLLFAMSCCTNDETKEDLQSTFFEKVYKIDVEETAINVSNIGRVEDMASFDKYLVFYSPAKDYLFQIYDTSNGKFVCNLGKIGQGPNEFSPSTRMAFSKEKGVTKLCLFDMQNKKYSEYDILNSIKNKELSAPYSTFSCKNANSLSVTKIDDSLYVSSGIFKKRFILMSNNGKILDEAGEYPFYKESKKPATILSLAYQGELLSNEKSRSAVFITQSSPNIDFVQLINRKLLLKKKYHIEAAKFKSSEGKETYAAISKSNKFGYVSACADDKYIYTLYSGQTIQDVGFYKALTGKTIQIFNWNGEAVCEYRIDADINHIAISDDGQFLYGYIEGEVPEVVKFKISSENA